jgi:hypothetical protein
MWIYFWQTGNQCTINGDTNIHVLAGFTLFMYASYLFLFAKMYVEKHYGSKSGAKKGVATGKKTE